MLEDVAASAATPDAAPAPEAAKPESVKTDSAPIVSADPKAALEPVETKPVATVLGDDWRDRIAGEDKKFKEQLARFASPENYFSSTRELHKALSAGDLKPAKLAENATETEKAKFLKSWGVPETPDGYGVDLPLGVGLEWSDADKDMLKSVLGKMHGAHAPPAFVKAALDGYLEAYLKQRADMQDAATEKTVNARAEIKAEWGRDYDANIRVANDFMVKVLGEDRAKALAQRVMADGTVLGDDPDFARYMAGAARAVGGDTAMALPDMLAGGADPVAEYKKALGVMHTDPKLYVSDAYQQKMLALKAAADRHTARRAA